MLVKLAPDVAFVKHKALAWRRPSLSCDTGQKECQVQERRAERKHRPIQFGLTQAELAQLLKLGGNTVSRWESGRNVQTAAMDLLLKMIRDLPGSLDYLLDRAA